MKTRNEFKSYLIIWALVVVVFHILIFLFCHEMIGDRLTTDTVVFKDGTTGIKEVLKPEFLIALYSYIFVILAFIGQLICTKIFLSQESLQKTLYHYPIFNLSLRGLVLTIIFAAVFLVSCIKGTPINPYIALICFLLTLIFIVFTCVSSKTAANMVSAKDENIALKTQYMKLLKGEAESLSNRVKDAKNRELVKAVFDEIRFSDPLSIPDLMNIEQDMITKFENIKANVDGEYDKLKAACEDFSSSLKDRNSKLKALKK